MNKTHKAGYNAYYDGLDSEDCPHESLHDIENFNMKRYHWMIGYFFARIEDKCKSALEKNKQEWIWENSKGK
jgi:hypothetical protein